jgi:hypothetical protein
VTHLWEIEHPYYCNDGNYYAAGNKQPFERYESWADFFEAEGNSDLDMNLVFRWDWRKADPQDEHWGNKKDELLIYFMGQRKGLYRWVKIEINDSNEAAVREWLAKRWQHLVLLWQGISPPLASEDL